MSTEAMSQLAWVISQSACLNAKVAGMQEQNRMDREAGRTLTYNPEDFDRVTVEYGLTHNQVVPLFQGL